MHDDFESVIYGDFNFEGMRDGADVSELETLGDCECVCRWMLCSGNNFFNRKIEDIVAKM